MYFFLIVHSFAMSCVLCLDASKYLVPETLSEALPPLRTGAQLPGQAGPQIKSHCEANKPCTCPRSMLMLQAMNYIHGAHELLLQSLCEALKSAPLCMQPKSGRHLPNLSTHFLRAAPRELRDIIGQMNRSTTTTAMTRLLRRTNSLKRFVAASKSEASLSDAKVAQAVLPSASTSERVLAILLFVWGHQCRDADTKQLKQAATTLGVPLRRLQMACHWHALACTYPGLLRLTLPGYKMTVLWESAHDLRLLLDSLSQDEAYRDKILGLMSGHLCFECVVSVAESKCDIY